jgi:high-affinity nickel-transport protein
MSVLPVLSLGFLLGMTHATDADHVAAMSTVVAQRQSSRASGGLRSAAWAGTLWGLGHTAMVVLVGGAIVLFRLAVPDKVALALELGVAAMLVGLGARALFGRAPAEKAHAHPPPRHAGMRSLGIGLVHGLAGSAGVALAVLTDIDSPGVGVAYLGLFGVGTVAGMAIVTAVLAVPFLVASARFRGLTARLARLAGCASLVLGLALAYRIGFVDGLFV